ncbi:5-formyltetrahydrofolate cyclo-ligase [Prochlorococcus sp. MIT 1223]|uniref:5-formyltetrahydrofolate cyclo-ligase n=1 Tax=Prochlorococcus sp. MIT 1223 TaxID=3096217 RepID=UPI002A752689|nr:5-formyltetrahydrofolate cyclo-ligase [Prochlorococcus sp. MIT 1223]
MNIKKSKLISRKNFSAIREKSLKRNELKIYNNVEYYLKKNFRDNSSNLKKYIGIYWPLAGEVDLRELKDTINASFALPCCEFKGEMQYRDWTNEKLNKDACGIPAPCKGKLIKPEEMRIIFVPALAIDKKGFRLGYGGGYFDRLRENKSWRSILSFAVLPGECVSKAPLPLDPWDIPFDGWITEDGEHQIKT